jgi:hypothetical protein
MERRLTRRKSARTVRGIGFTAYAERRPDRSDPLSRRSARYAASFARAWASSNAAPAGLCTAICRQSAARRLQMLTHRSRSCRISLSIPSPLNLLRRCSCLRHSRPPHKCVLDRVTQSATGRKTNHATSMWIVRCGCRVEGFAPYSSLLVDTPCAGSVRHGRFERQCNGRHRQAR